MKALINSEIQNSSEAFVRHFAKPVYSGMVTAKMLDQFTELVKESFSQVIGDYITNTFKTALIKEAEQSEKLDEIQIEFEPTTKKIITTDEELEGFF